MNKEKATKTATELVDALDQLCEDITNQHAESFPRLSQYFSCSWKKGQKFIKIITRDTFNGEDNPSQSVWGFINLKHDKFQVGDVLMAKSWAAPALNKPRGNLLDGYTMNPRRQNGPDYL